MSEDEGREIWFINRDVIVVRPAPPFVEWALALEDDGDLNADDVQEASNAFLIPEFDHPDETWAWVEAHCETLFEYMLLDWVTDKDAWPQDRGWAAFQSWFTYEHISLAWDLVDEPLTSDAPPFDGPEPEGWDA